MSHTFESLAAFSDEELDTADLTPCHWVEFNLCSACVQKPTPAPILFGARWPSLAGCALSVPETEEELQNLIRGFCGAIDGSLRELTGRRVGYCLMLFDFGDEGSVVYGSNATRDDMIKELANFRRKLQERQT
jgi:hypothetical protein